MLAASRFAKTDRAIVLVCDGAGPPANWPKGRRTSRSAAHRSIRLEFAGHGIEADSALERMIAERPRLTGKASELGPTLVVSSDKRVRAAALLAGLEVRQSEDFLSQVAADWLAVTGTSQRPSPHAKAKPEFDPADAATWHRALSADTPEVHDMLRDAERAMRAMREDAARRAASQQASPAAAKPARKAAPPKDSAPAKSHDADSTLRELLEDCGQNLRLDDLNMDKWLKNPPPSP